MGTVQQATQKAIKLWQMLTRQQQEQLLTVCQGERVIQFDTTGKKRVQVVSYFFGMDLSYNSDYVYLFPDEARAHLKQEDR